MPPENAKKIFEKMHEVVDHPEKTREMEREVKKLAREGELPPRLLNLL